MIEDNKKLIAEVIIHNYPRKIVVSKARNPKYIQKGKDKLNKTQESKLGIDYEWKPFGVTRKGKRVNLEFLVEIDTKQRVVKNSRTVGKPKYLAINGQRLHQLNLQDYERKKIIDELKTIMAGCVANLDPIRVRPLIIDGELHDYYWDAENTDRAGNVNKNDSSNWDMDNRELFYNKTFQDVLTGCKTKNPNTGKIVATSKVIIPDDHRGYITQAPKLKFVPLKKNDTPKLIYRIYQDLRSEIINTPFYNGDVL